MLKEFILVVAGLSILFFGYVATREGKFYYERSGVINAPAEKIYPYLSNFKLGSRWNPYDRNDPNIKRTFIGEDGQVGSAIEFDGNSQTGSGRLEMLALTANTSVEIKLIMTKPFHAESMIHYKLTPEGEATRFTWSMSGDSGFMGKLINVFIDCEKMMTDQFEVGIKILTTVVEGQK